MCVWLKHKMKKPEELEEKEKLSRKCRMSFSKNTTYQTMSKPCSKVNL